MFNTANLFLATKNKLAPVPFFPSADDFFTDPTAIFGSPVNSNPPSSLEIINMTERSAGWKLRVRGDTQGKPIAHVEKANVGAGADVVAASVFTADVVDGVTVQGKGGAFALKLEDDGTIVMAWFVISHWFSYS